MDNLTTMSIEELEELIERAQTILASKRQENALTFTFDFDHTVDPRKGKPYVARLFWETVIKDGKKVGQIGRSFFQMDVRYGKKEVTVIGQFTAKTGDIIEQRTGGSWKNDYRDWYVVTEMGELKHIANIGDSRKRYQVEKYLNGKLTLTELLGEAS